MITIPKDHHRAVERLLSLKPESLANLAAAIAKAPPASSFRSFAARLDEQLKPPIPGIAGMIQVLATLGIISQEDETPDDTADQLIVAAERDHLYKPESDADRSQTKGQLAQLLKSSQPLILTGKARQLLSEHQHVYCEGNSRIISDIRPIFPPGELASPIGTVIVHMLKLAYHEATESKEFYVALDTEDVRLLRDLLDRAIAKEAKLRVTLSQSKFPYIGDYTEDD